jgi:uroporphyrinogen-III synthase
MPFAGLRVISLESRRAEDMEALIRRYHGEPFVAPSVRERPLEDHREAFRFVDRLLENEFDMVIFLTGAGLVFLRDLISARMPVERFAEGLRKVTVVARGPKPVVVLQQLGVPVQVRIPEPNTWKEILVALENRSERRIAIQEYGQSNRELIAALEARGADVTPVPVYRWELPFDIGPLREAARRIASGECDVVLFTTSIQLRHLLQVASEMNLEEPVLRALKKDVVVGSVGPIMTAALSEAGVEPDVAPHNPKMGALVKLVAEQAGVLLHRKRCTQQEKSDASAATAPARSAPRGDSR